MEDQKQPFAAFVLETLTRQSMELGQWWAERVQLIPPEISERDDDHDKESPASGLEQLVRTLLVVAADGTPYRDSLTGLGSAIGAGAHRQNISLHLMLQELDLLGALLLRAAEHVAGRYPESTGGHEGLAVARRIADVMSRLRLAATTGYAQAIEDDLRERYRAIRHDLRNPLGTIRTAVALLVDESAPPEIRESLRVRAMVIRNTSSLDQMIGEALGDAAARLPAFGTPRELSADSRATPPASGGEERDDIARAQQRPDLETGSF